MIIDLTKELTSRGIPFERTEFPSEAFTVQAVADALLMRLEQIAKAMLVRVSDGSYAIAVVPGNCRLGVSTLSVLLNGKTATMAKRSEISKAISVAPGAVTPLLALVRPELCVLVDEKLLSERTINISSGDLTVGINMAPVDLVRVTNGRVGSITEALEA